MNEPEFAVGDIAELGDRTIVVTGMAAVTDLPLKKGQEPTTSWRYFVQDDAPDGVWSTVRGNWAQAYQLTKPTGE